MAAAEETDIDAVEVPLPGSESLEFSRGVTDLDAVGNDGGSHADSKVGRRRPLEAGHHKATPGVNLTAHNEVTVPQGS